MFFILVMNDFCSEIEITLTVPSGDDGILLNE